MATCFLHSCTMEPGATRVLDHLVDYAGHKGLFGLVDRFVIRNIGAAIKTDRYERACDRIVVVNDSPDMTGFENGTIRSLADHARRHRDDKVLYLHTKGASYPETHPFSPNIRDWVDFMLYCLVDHAASCLAMLDHVDAVGCDYRHASRGENPSHFSGNFWWATSRYLAMLPVEDLTRRHDAEFWLFRNRPTFVNIHRCPHGHYENPYEAERYADIVSHKIGLILQNLQSPHEPVILYGVEGRYLDVTGICRRDLRQGDEIRIPAGDAERNAAFSDPAPGAPKHIRIGGMTYPPGDDLCFRMKGPS